MPTKVLLAAALLLTMAGCAPAPDVSTTPAGSTAYVRHLQPDQFDTWRGVHYDALVIDLRSPVEWDDELSHLDNATLVPIEDLEARLEEFAGWRAKTVLLYDRTGTSLARAGQILVTRGFQDVSVLDGGLKAYRDWQKTR